MYNKLREGNSFLLDVGGLDQDQHGQGGLPQEAERRVGIHVPPHGGQKVQKS